jgi:hypothetical protein
MAMEAAQYPNELLCCDEIFLPSGNNCLNGSIHVYCNGFSPGKCIRILSDVNGYITVYAVYAVGYCDDASTGTLYLDESSNNGSTWANLNSSAGCDGALDWCYWAWIHSYFGTTGRVLRFRFGSDIDNPTHAAVWRLNWYYAILHIQDHTGTPLTGITTTWTSSDGQSGSGTTSVINILVPSGTSVTYSCAEGGAGCFPVAAEVCSTTISNITEDTTSITKMYPIDFCLTFDYVVSVGATLAACFDIVIKNNDISDSPRSCEILILEDGSEIGTEIIYPNTWSDEYTIIGGALFSFRVGEIFYGGELNVIEIFEFCFSNIPNKSINVDSSTIYVDCANGDNANSGRCSFTNAVKTITYAQTLIDNNGTIKVKYGNCLGENITSVLNPIVATVHISPVQDETTNGTGSVVISDA